VFHLPSEYKCIALVAKSIVITYYEFS